MNKRLIIVVNFEDETDLEVTLDSISDDCLGRIYDWAESTDIGSINSDSDYDLYLTDGNSSYTIND
jgi:hypothetical protein